MRFSSGHLDVMMATMSCSEDMFFELALFAILMNSAYKPVGVWFVDGYSDTILLSQMSQDTHSGCGCPNSACHWVPGFLPVWGRSSVHGECPMSSVICHGTGTVEC